jgi:hypothetical protein
MRNLDLPKKKKKRYESTRGIICGERETRKVDRVNMQETVIRKPIVCFPKNILHS